MKNKIIGIHPLVGKITYQDIIDDINLIIQDYNYLEMFISRIIDLDEDDNELVDIILNNDICNRLENISYVLKTLL